MNNLRTVLHPNARIGFRAYGVVSGEGLYMYETAMSAANP